MERKSLGSFLSTLRKANGMKQKELAQRLNVSDKSVSRLECDDGAPDLSIIPALAEIFEGSCDELLCGERLPAGNRAHNRAADRKDLCAAGICPSAAAVFCQRITGMSGADWLKTGLLCAAAAVLLWAILLFLLWPVLIRRRTINSRR